MKIYKSDMAALFMTFLLIVVGLALTPTVVSSCDDARYIGYSQANAMDPATSNSTATTYTARNDSLTYAYFTITLNDTSNYGLTTVDCSSNITYTVATKTLAFDVGVLNVSKDYLATIGYFYIAMDATSQALLLLVPLFYIVIILAVGAVAVYAQFKGMKGG